MPATNATSERSFSKLRLIKTYLRTTMRQEQLNHLMILFVYKELVDNLDLKKVVSEFIANVSPVTIVCEFRILSIMITGEIYIPIKKSYCVLRVLQI